MTKMLQDKLTLAEQRKRIFQFQRKILVAKKNWQYFENSLTMNENRFFKNIDIFDRYQEEKRKDVEVKHTNNKLTSLSFPIF